MVEMQHAKSMGHQRGVQWRLSRMPNSKIKSSVPWAKEQARRPLREIKEKKKKKGGKRKKNLAATSTIGCPTCEAILRLTLDAHWPHHSLERTHFLPILLASPLSEYHCAFRKFSRFRSGNVNFWALLAREASRESCVLDLLTCRDMIRCDGFPCTRLPRLWTIQPCLKYLYPTPITPHIRAPSLEKLRIKLCLSSPGVH